MRIMSRLVPEEDGGSTPHSLRYEFEVMTIGTASQKSHLKAQSLRRIAKQLDDDDAKNTHKAKRVGDVEANVRTP